MNEYKSLESLEVNFFTSQTDLTTNELWYQELARSECNDLEELELPMPIQMNWWSKLDRGLLPSSGKVDLVIESLELQMRRDPASWQFQMLIVRFFRLPRKCTTGKFYVEGYWSGAQGCWFVRSVLSLVCANPWFVLWRSFRNRIGDVLTWFDQLNHQISTTTQKPTIH